MLDWLKFFPYASKDDNKPAEVRGPYFSKPRRNKWLLGDCTLCFDAPWANPIFSLSQRGDTVDAISPGRGNVLQAQLKNVFKSRSSAPPSEWDRHIFYSNTWFFVGPWFTGFQADLCADGLLITADRDSSFIGKNLLHPRVFESAVANYLDNTYGYEKNGRNAHFRGPLNWRVLPISSRIQAVVCDIHTIGNTSKENPCLTRHVYIPITPQRFILIRFSFGGVLINEDEIRAKPLLKLCDSIIDSLHLDVGSKTQAEWDTVKQSCPDMSIAESIGEFQWPLKVVKPFKKPQEVDITPSLNALKHQPNDDTTS